MTDITSAAPESRTTPTGAARWRVAGGAPLLLAAVLLLVATLIEAAVLPHPDRHDGLFWTFAALFALSSILFLVAAVPLAFGTDGEDGVVGSSATGRTALLAFAVFWILAQGLYLVGTYLAPASGWLAASTVLSILMLACAAVAAVVVVMRHVVSGAARWSMLGAVVVSAVTGGVASGTDDVTIVTVMHCLSAAGFAAVAISYLTARPRRLR